MPKTHKPTTPSQRSYIKPSQDQLTKNKAKAPKKLLKAKRRTNGRNSLGRITVRHRGGGHKRKYRLIDFKRQKDDIQATVKAIEYDPNRSAFIALLHYADGEKSYIIAPKNLTAGDKVMSGKEAPIKPGCSKELKDMPLGSTVHAVEMYPGRGAALIRSAGTSAQYVAKNNGYATIKMPSGEIRLVRENCRATFGTVSNSENNLKSDGKAGRSRWRGIRPTVRGTVMNPVDHPHGGGEGKNKGNIPQSPTGVLSKGFRTRSKRKSNKMIVKDRRKK
ncbi:MAG: 50S ribosomal protein L2 [Chlamydiia bacterium]|nr:50S ribosomal protein L2 [Chlamydiia bacterium]